MKKRFGISFLLPADVLKLSRFVLPEHGEVLHPGHQVLGGAFLLLGHHRHTADVQRQSDVVNEALQRKVLVVGEAVACELGEEADLNAQERLLVDATRSTRQIFRSVSPKATVG